MARPKKQVKLKEPIKIRLKSLADGNKSIYLDIYYKGVRKYEYLKLYLVPEINPVCKEQNKQTMVVAERIKAERIKALHGHGIQDWETVKQGSMLLTTWIKKYCEGGVGIKKSTLHCRVEMLHTVEKYLEETNKGFISLEEVNAEFCRGYVKFLRNFPNSHIKYGEPRPISENTASRYLGMFSTALNNTVRQGIIRNNPMKELDARERIQPKDGKKEYLNNMPDGLDPTAIWYMMKHHCQYHQAERTVGRKLERFMTTFVLSPSKEESANFTMEDWANLQYEALDVLDSVGLTPNGFSNEIKTNFTNSMNVGGLHSDSKSGTMHLHIDCCRVDMEGNTNDVHDIHLRAMKAAEIINMRHGWEQPQEIRNMRKVELAEDCEHTLKDMQQFNIDRYFNLLRMKGYEVKPRYDKQWKLVGYTVGKNASVFKASEIGRKFMASKIEDTWKKLHPQPTQVKTKPVSPSVAPASRPVRPVVQTQTASQPKAQPQITQTAFTINIGDEVKKVWIPNAVKDVFTNEVQIPEDNNIATTENVAHVAMLLFAGYIDAATSMSKSCGGGGSAPSSGWGKKDDEDDWKFAHRCAQIAHSMCKPKPRSRSFHR